MTDALFYWFIAAEPGPILDLTCNLTVYTLHRRRLRPFIWRAISISTHTPQELDETLLQWRHARHCKATYYKRCVTACTRFAWVRCVRCETDGWKQALSHAEQWPLIIQLDLEFRKHKNFRARAAFLDFPGWPGTNNAGRGTNCALCSRCNMRLHAIC